MPAAAATIEAVSFDALGMALLSVRPDSLGQTPCPFTARERSARRTRCLDFASSGFRSRLPGPLAAGRLGPHARARSWARSATCWPTARSTSPRWRRWRRRPASPGRRSTSTSARVSPSWTRSARPSPENPALVALRQAVELEDADAALDQLIANSVRFWASEEAILRQLYGAAAIDPVGRGARRAADERPARRAPAASRAAPRSRTARAGAPGSHRARAPPRADELRDLRGAAPAGRTAGTGRGRHAPGRRESDAAVAVSAASSYHFALVHR